jgi:hypothetical protein
MYEVGDRIKWYDYYACGDIVRSVGLGLIVNFKEYQLNSYNVADCVIIYEVLKDGGSLDHFEQFQLQLN